MIKMFLCKGFSFSHSTKLISQMENVSAAPKINCKRNLKHWWEDLIFF